MDNRVFERILQLYHSYVKDLAFSPEIELKYQHSINVANLANRISEFVTPSKIERQLIEIASLYHDIGRFKQFATYHTFNDRISENHATLGVQVIKEHNFFADLDLETQEVLFNIIKNHNTKTVSKDLTPVELLCCNVLRDADKLDILRLLSAHYKTGEYNATLSLGLPDKEEYNPLILNQLLNASIVDVESMQSVNDFKLLNLSWVYDLNFAVSHALLFEFGYLKQIYQSLSVKDAQIDLAYQMVDGICEAYVH